MTFDQLALRAPTGTRPFLSRDQESRERPSSTSVPLDVPTLTSSPWSDPREGSSSVPEDAEPVVDTRSKPELLHRSPGQTTSGQTRVRNTTNPSRVWKNS